MQNNLLNELSTNFIEYAVAVNTDRAIPDAKSGLKPVAKRILYGAFDEGYSSAKPHVKCANIVGKVMADWHPHGDSSIYGALVRLSQNWVMRYPLIDFHGSNGNRDGDGPAAYRYTEARLAKIAEDGLLAGIKKKNVDFIPNYSETKDEPVTLPSIFPNLLCNPNTGIGVAIACNWLPHNLIEVSQAINDYMDGKEPLIPGPDFPTGGQIINGNELPNIIKSGKGSVKVRGKYNIEDNNIVFYEIPYGIATEDLMTQIGAACDEGKITGVKNIRNESNRKGFRLVIECDKNVSYNTVINLLFKETDLQTSISYNQVALVDKTPVELSLKDCIKIYIEHNVDCITRETEFDKKKAEDKLEIIEGLLKAMEDIDNIIALIKKSDSAATAKVALMNKYGFTESQAKAIVDMKLGKLAGLEKIEIQNEKANLLKQIENYNLILSDVQSELRKRLAKIVSVYGDERKTEITNITEKTKEDKEIEFIQPEKCVVVLTEGGNVKRIPSSSFRTQHRSTKGVKTQNDITSSVIRTNTIDALMIFSDKGNMYRLIVNNIPEGTNSSKGTAITSLVKMNFNEKPSVIYSIYKDNPMKYVLFLTKNGIVKKTPIEEYLSMKKSGLAAIKLQENDEVASVTMCNDDEVIIATKRGQILHIDSKDIPISSRMAIGVKGVKLNEGDEAVAIVPIRDKTDTLGIFSEDGMGKRVKLSEFTKQGRNTKGVRGLPKDKTLAAIVLINDGDKILINGDKGAVYINCNEISTSLGRDSTGVLVIKNNKIMSVSKV